MKLKKIVSLALAVSMLAGCKGSSSSSEGDGTVVTPVSGVTASINAELDDNKDIIEFTDSTELKNFLTSYFDNYDITLDDLKNVGTTVVYNGTLNANVAAAAVSAKLADEANFTTSITVDSEDEDTKAVEVYVLNGHLTEANVLNLVGQHLDGLTLPEEYIDSGEAKKDYAYDGSIAVVKAETEGKTESAWVVAVVINKDVKAK